MARAVTPSRILGLAIGAAFAAPAAFVVWRTIQLNPSFSEVASEIAGPFWRTIQLAVLVGASTAMIGTALAWLTARTDLPGRSVWRIVLVLPLALPSFVGAAAFITGLAPGGVIHEALALFGLTPPRRFRGLGASWLVLTVFTYPYVMLPVAARLRALRPSLEESARMLGTPPIRTFVRVTLPQLRPAVLGGTLLVFLYTLSEFGAVQLLGYDTLTRVIFATRQIDRALSFASACVLLVLAVAVVGMERHLRGPAPPDTRATVTARSARLGAWRWPALAICTIVLSLGLIIPLASLTGWARRGIADGRVSFSELIDPTVSTASVAVATALIAVVVVLPVATAATRRPHPLSNVAAGAIVGGFAMPGLVIALALAVFALNTPVLGFLYQTLPLLIIAYVVHFGSQALTSSEQAARAVPTQLREQSRLLQPNPIRRLWTVDWPIMRPGLLAGGGLVILATVKELPATLLLAPIGFSTLATEVWASYEEGFYAATGLSSLVLVAVSAFLTWLLVLRRSDF